MALRLPTFRHCPRQGMALLTHVLKRLRNFTDLRRPFVWHAICNVRSGD
jgi:hypothetical protein